MAQTIKLPRRAEGMLEQRVGDEVVVVDSTTQHAHALTGLSAAVWNASETGTYSGTATPAEIERVVDELLDAGLLLEPSHLSRRRVLQGAGALAVAGGVMAIGIPSAAAASSGTVVFGPGSHLLSIPASTGLVVQFALVAAGGGKQRGNILHKGGHGGAISGTMRYTGPATNLTVIVGGAGADGGPGSLVNIELGQGGNGGTGGSGGGGRGGDGGAILEVNLHRVKVQVGSDFGGGGGGGGSAIVSGSSFLAVAGGGGGGSSLSGGTNGSASGTSATSVGAGGEGGDGAPAVVDVLAYNVGGGGGGGGAQPGTGGAAKHGGAGGQGFYAAAGGFTFSGVTTSTTGADGFGGPGVSGYAAFTAQGISAV